MGMLALRVSCLLLVLATLTASELDRSNLDLTGGRQGLALGGARQEVSFREKREAGRGQKRNLRKKWENGDWKKRTNGRRNQVRRNGQGRRRNMGQPNRKPRRGKNGKKRPNRPNGPKVLRGGPRQNDDCAQKTSCMTGLATTSAWFGNQARNHFR